MLILLIYSFPQQNMKSQEHIIQLRKQEVEFENDNKKNLGMWLLIKPNVLLILKIKKKIEKGDSQRACL